LLKPNRAQPCLLGTSQPHGHEPTPERDSRPVQDGPSGQRCLPFARSTENGRPRCGPAVITPTRRAYEPLRPPKAAQVLPTRLVRRKPLCKFHDCARERVVHTRRIYHQIELEQSA
jgi:hypothetical protein